MLNGGIRDFWTNNPCSCHPERGGNVVPPLRRLTAPPLPQGEAFSKRIPPKKRREITPALSRKCLFYTFIHHFLANIKLRSILPYKIDLNFLFCIQIFPKGFVGGEDNEIFFSALLADKDADLGGIYVGAIVKAFSPVFFCRLF